MAETEQDRIVANYNELREARGWSWEQMADHLPHDPHLAAHLRSQGEPKRDKAPKGRAAASKSDG